MQDLQCSGHPTKGTGGGGDRVRGSLARSSVCLGSELNGQEDTAGRWWPWPAPPEGDGAALTLSRALRFTSTWCMGVWLRSPSHQHSTARGGPSSHCPKTQLLKLTCYPCLRALPKDPSLPAENKTQVLPLGTDSPLILFQTPSSAIPASVPEVTRSCHIPSPSLPWRRRLLYHLGLCTHCPSAWDALLQL